MNTTPSDRDWTERIGRGDASRLLRLGLEPERSAGRPPEPLDRFAEILAAPPAPLPGPATLLVGEGTAPLALLRTLKTAAQERFAPDCAAAERLAAGVWYYLAVAAARVHHGVLITSRPVAEVEVALAGLARRVPEPWRGLLHRAVALLGAVPPG